MLEIASGILIAFKLMGFIGMTWTQCLIPFFIDLVLSLFAMILGAFVGKD